MTPNDFKFIAELLKEKSGFSLTANQIYLLESRLGPILRQNNLISLEDLINSLRLNNVELRDSVIEAVSINNTRFFRNKYVFLAIQGFLKACLAEKPLTKKIKILSAGCASGQEPVSIAILLKEMNLPDDVKTDVYALDMSKQIIARAKQGTYTHYEVQKGLAIRLLLKYFTQQDEMWKLKPEILKTIHYQVHNMMKPLYEKNFDVVLCRNMLSYMTETAQKTAISHIENSLEPGGLLIIGASETLHDNPNFEKIPEQLGCYRFIGTPALPQKEQNTAWTLIKKPLFKPAIPNRKIS